MPTYLFVGLAFGELIGLAWTIALYRQAFWHEVHANDITYLELLVLLLLVAFGWPLLVYNHYREAWSNPPKRA